MEGIQAATAGTSRPSSSFVYPSSIGCTRHVHCRCHSLAAGSRVLQRVAMSALGSGALSAPTEAFQRHQELQVPVVVKLLQIQLLTPVSRKA